MSERAPGVRLLVLSGSVRAGSLNAAALRAASRLLAAADGTARIEPLLIDRLPFFDADLADAVARQDAAGPGTVHEVARVTAALRAADGLLVATPEYNGNPPGLLLNALDWLSRDLATGPLLGLPVATISASPGSGGGANAQARLRGVLSRCGARLAAPAVALDRAGQRLDTAGEFTDAHSTGLIQGAVRPLLTACRAVAARRAKVRP
ncbi:NADPH-dependent FMN reductase [Streptomyces sp. NPDC004031]